MIKKYLSPEFIVWIVCTIFGVGVAYQAIAGEVKALKERTDGVEVTVSVLRGESIENRKDIEYIKDGVKEMRMMMRKRYAE